VGRRRAEYFLSSFLEEERPRVSLPRERVYECVDGSVQFVSNAVL
jgi:hypothetical protein